MSVLKKSVLATGAAALLLSLGTASIAQAGPKGPQGFKNGQGLSKTFHPKHHHHHHKHWHGNGWGPKIVIGGGYGGYGGCGYYQRMFWKTGNYYWKAKYYDCMY
ncbi:MAG: hypothetical protein Q7T86_13025 [Hyphomicrobiaceae bacterium]|jgi:hypothetical protein|nr:hypothetical protein [Hyphomicrobiaceae bacterium]